MRYEYRPGSTLFVVWQQGRSNYLTRDDEGYNDGYSFRRDYGSRSAITRTTRSW